MAPLDPAAIAAFVREINGEIVSGVAQVRLPTGAYRVVARTDNTGQMDLTEEGQRWYGELSQAKAAKPAKRGRPRKAVADLDGAD